MKLVLWIAQCETGIDQAEFGHLDQPDIAFVFVQDQTWAMAAIAANTFSAIVFASQNPQDAAAFASKVQNIPVFYCTERGTTFRERKTLANYLESDSDLIGPGDAPVDLLVVLVHALSQ